MAVEGERVDRAEGLADDGRPIEAERVENVCQVVAVVGGGPRRWWVVGGSEARCVQGDHSEFVGQVFHLPDPHPAAPECPRQPPQGRPGAALPIGDGQAADLDPVNLRRYLLITHNCQYQAKPNARTLPRPTTRTFCRA